MPNNAYWYNNALFQAFKSTLDLENDTLEVLLVDSNYTFNPVHVNVDEITNEVTNASGTGYERKSVTGFIITKDDVNDKINFDCNDVNYVGINTNEDIRALVLYKFVTNDTDHQLIGYFQGTVLPTNGSDLQVVIDADGLADLLNTTP